MRRRIIHRVAAILGLAVTLQTAGCASFLGLGVGALADRSRPPTVISRSEWPSLPSGTEVDVVFTDGFRVRGRTVALVDADSEGVVWRIRTDSGDQSIPVSEIRKLTRPRAHRSAVIGFSVGLAIDVAVAALAAVAVTQELGD